MLRLLLLLASNSAALIGKARFRRALLDLLTRAAGLLVVGCLGLVAAAFATAALFLWLDQYLATPVAALIMALFFLLLAAIVFFVLRSTRREEGAASGAAKEADSVRQAAESAFTAVTRQPGKSVLMAVITGVAVGIALRRR